MAFKQKSQKRKDYIVLSREETGLYEFTKKPMTKIEALRLAKLQRKSLPYAKTRIMKVK